MIQRGDSSDSVVSRSLAARAAILAANGIEQQGSVAGSAPNSRKSSDEVAIVVASSRKSSATKAVRLEEARSPKGVPD